jgi:hypothetical protein
MTRRELLTMIGAVAVAGCRAQSPAGDQPQQSDLATATLTISGMI